MPGMTTHRDFAEKSEQEFEYFYSCYSLLVFDPELEPLSDLSIEPIVKHTVICIYMARMSWGGDLSGTTYITYKHAKDLKSNR
jgi:hypothetical protein